jgi:hypothetical protein
MEVILDEQQCNILKKASGVNKREEKFLEKLQEEIIECYEFLFGYFDIFNKSQKNFKLVSYYGEWSRYTEIKIKNRKLRKQYGIRWLIQILNYDKITVNPKLKDYSIFLYFVQETINFIQNKSQEKEFNLDKREDFLLTIRSLNISMEATT